MNRLQPGAGEIVSHHSKDEFTWVERNGHSSVTGGKKEGNFYETERGILPYELHFMLDADELAQSVTANTLKVVLDYFCCAKKREGEEDSRCCGLGR